MVLSKFKYIAFVMLLFFVSCLNNKNTGTRRAYHNMTSRYNVMFNAQEVMKQSRTQFLAAYLDDFSKILPVYPYGNEDEAKALYPDMDTVIKKCEKNISYHSIRDRGEEQVKWIDDTWLLLSQAHFYKRDYEQADKSLGFMFTNYGNKDIIYEARLWRARTKIELQSYDRAAILLKSLEKDLEAAIEAKEGGDKAKEGKKKKNAISKSKRKNKSSRNWKSIRRTKKGRSSAARKKAKKGESEEEELEFPINKLAEHVYATRAVLFIKQENYEEAAQELEKALETKPPKYYRARWNYVLGQIYAKLGNHDKSVAAYEKVVKLKQSYDLEINARIQMALSTSGDSEDELKELRGVLKKMARDVKNKDFLDQIYYALADVEFKLEDEEQAIEYLHLSVVSSTRNRYQKGLSYLKLADHYFKVKSYNKAQEYYDSTAQILPEDYPNYLGIKNKSESLNQLVFDLNTITFQDSIQMVSKMDPQEREVFIAQLIEQKIEEEKRLREEAQKRMEAQARQNANATNNKIPWIFDNPAMLGIGFAEFNERWGERKLEDHWRRKNKQASFEEDPQSVDTSTALTFRDPEFYLKDLIAGEAAFAKSDSLIIEAYYDAGILYKERIFDNEEAIKMFTTLNKRFPENRYRYTSFYQLYRIYSKMGDQSNAQKYKNFLLHECPSCEVSKLIEDPDFLKKKKELEAEELKAFEKVYQQLAWENYLEVVQKSGEVVENDTLNNFYKQYLLLYIKGLRELKSIESYEKALNLFLKKYPNEDETPTVQAWLDKLKGNASNTTSAVQYDEQIANAAHYFVLIFDGSKQPVNAISTSYANFNDKYFSTKGLKSSVLVYEGSLQMLYINFTNLKDAEDYFKTLDLKKGEITPKHQDWKYFIVSKTNYKLFYQNKDLDNYISFFNKTYQL